MKRAVFVVLQMILLLAVFLVGSLLPGAKVMPMLSVAMGPGRMFVYDGVLLMLGVYVVMLVIAAARRRIATSGVNASIALVFALVLGLVMKFGFVSA